MENNNNKIYGHSEGHSFSCSSGISHNSSTCKTDGNANVSDNLENNTMNNNVTDKIETVTLEVLNEEIKKLRTEVIVNRFILGALFLIALLYMHSQIQGLKDIIGTLVEIFMSV